HLRRGALTSTLVRLVPRKLLVEAEPDAPDHDRPDDQREERAPAHGGLIYTPVLEGVRVLVVVPAFNEAARLPRVVESMPREVDHVIVVDDASTDGTTAAGIFIRHDTNRGVGAAIATGYRRALAMPGGPRDAFVVMAGDGQMDPRDLPALVSPIARG